MTKLYSIDFQLYKVTGVEKVMLDIHHAVKDVYQAKIVGNIPYRNVDVEHGIKEEEYIQLKNWLMFRNSIVILHERRLLLFFWILNHLFFQNIKIVYVHHNIYHNHKYTSLFPQTIVAIADSGIDNLVNYFRVPAKNVCKIYNCVIDKNDGSHVKMNRNEIKILLPGRINNQKQQVEIVRQLSGKLDSRIRIMFAGDGPNLDELKTMCKAKDNFTVLGFRNDIIELLKEVDFVLLYSMYEGLPITLIEATMAGLPIICNDVGGNTEICYNGENGWVVNDWDELIKTLNDLTNIKDDQYQKMCKRSRAIYCENFTFEMFKQKYIDLLGSL